MNEHLTDCNAVIKMYSRCRKNLFTKLFSEHHFNQCSSDKIVTSVGGLQCFSVN